MRRTIALGFLVAACASPGSPRYVLLESDSYVCGAVEGLGCGLALEPVLRSIDRVDGVAQSSASWDGRHFRVEVRPGADHARVAQAAAALLEGEACCVLPPYGEASPPGAGPWFDAEEVVALSRHEAGVIARRLSTAIAAEISLEPEAAEHLHSLLLGELERAFERAHATGGGVYRLREQILAGRPSFEARSTQFLTPSQHAQVSAILARELGE